MYKPFLKTRFIGKNIHYVTSCHSTNDIAAYKVRSGESVNGEITIAGEQTAGRGQRGRSWEAEKDLNLTFSIIFKPGNLLVKNQFSLSQAIALGVREYVASQTDGQVWIKWPNDVLINEHKVAGILIENSIRGSMVSAAVSGIGVNMNQISFESDRATSLARVAKKTFSLAEELESLALCIEKFYGFLQAGEYKRIREYYVQFLFGLEQPRRFVAFGRVIEGFVTGVTAEGRLVIQSGNGAQTFDIKEVVWKWE